MTRTFLTFLSCTIGFGWLTGCTSATPTPQEVTIFAGDRAYVSLPNTEYPWYGTLVADSGASEGFYTLAYGNKKQRVYTGRVVPQLEPLVGETVVVQGKLVGIGEGPPIKPGSELWPATIAAFEPQWIDCIVDGELATLEQKLSPGLTRRLTQEAGETRARVIISLCDNLEITPYFDVDELTELRAPLYAELGRELEPYGAEVQKTYWLIAGMVAELPLMHIRSLAARPDALYLSDAEETAPPP